MVETGQGIMGIQNVLRMRATLRRDVGTEVDPYGGRTIDVQELSPPLRCYVQPKVDRTITDSAKVIAITTFSIWAARNADIRNEDVITAIKDVKGGEIFPDAKYRVTSLVRRENHAEGILEQYG